jgi:hypothetical protein
MENSSALAMTKDDLIALGRPIVCAACEKDFEVYSKERKAPFRVGGVVKGSIGIGKITICRHCVDYLCRVREGELKSEREKSNG